MTYTFSFHIILACAPPTAASFSSSGMASPTILWTTNTTSSVPASTATTTTASASTFFSPGCGGEPRPPELAPRCAPLQRLADRPGPHLSAGRRARIPQLYGTKCVFTIHNIEYQGRYGPDLKDVRPQLRLLPRAYAGLPRGCEPDEGGHLPPTMSPPSPPPMPASSSTPSTPTVWRGLSPTTAISCAASSTASIPSCTIPPGWRVRASKFSPGGLCGQDRL